MPLIPVAVWWGVAALAAGIGTAIPIFAVGKAADDSSDAIMKIAPIAVAGIALGTYLIFKRK